MTTALLVMLLAVAPDPRPVDVTGCWELRHGAQTTFHLDAGGLKARSTFAERPRGGPQAWDEAPLAVGDAWQIQCRPLSQHGSFCRVRLAEDGLHVRVFALHHGRGAQGTLIEDFVAQRCAR